MSVSDKQQHGRGQPSAVWSESFLNTFQTDSVPATGATGWKQRWKTVDVLILNASKENQAPLTLWWYVCNIFIGENTYGIRYSYIQKRWSAVLDVKCEIPVEEVMSDGLIDSHASLLLQNLLQGAEAVHHHHRIWVPQQAVQLVHHRSVLNKRRQR